MRVVGDIEADGLYDSVTTIWCAVFKDIDTGVIRAFTPNEVKKIPAFLNNVDVLIMHNGAQYDLPVIKKVLGYTFKGLLLDTLAVSRMDRPKRTAHSLESWGLSLGFPKQDFEEWDRYSNEMLEYCINDVELTHHVAAALQCDRPNPPVRYRVITSLFRNLFLQEQNGWRIDQSHLERSIYMLNRWMGKIKTATLPHMPIIIERGTELSRPFKRDGNLSKITEKYCHENEVSPDSIGGPFHRVVFRHTSLDKPSEIKSLLLDQGWIPEQWNHDKSGNRTSPKLSIIDSFQGVEGNLGRLAVKYTQCKQRRAILSGWRNGLRVDGRLPSRVVGLAVTSRARHSIIANIPRNTSFFGKSMRKTFIAREGWVLVGADAEACQLRMLAARMGDPEYIHKVCNEDIHTVNMLASGLTDRTDAKTLIYALIFGASNAKLTRMLGRPAAPVRAALLESIPALRRLLAKVEEEWKATAKTRLNSWGKLEYYDGVVKGLDGRPIPINSSHKVLMGVLQSDEAILMQYAYNLYHNKRDRAGYKAGRDCSTCCWYHDEIQSECRPEIAEHIGSLKCESIVQAGEYLNIPCPMSGSYNVGNNWSETH